ncbi:MAG: hypothetical protein MMC23_007535 [Stictis urceolatum]|nr:hypothetical protein [Stictis urceolata]
MSDPKDRSIPQWQRQGPGDASQVALKEADKVEPAPATEAQARAPLLEQAKEFLQHDEIRDAPTDRKISFLEGKGLSNDEIQQLLGLSRNTEATSPSSSTDSKPEAKTTPPPPPPTIPSTADPSTSFNSSDSSSSSKDTPPVITYPEFLLHAQRPAPLVTRQRLLTTLYTTAAAATLIHATSTYLVQPMLASLTEARHALYSSTNSNLAQLNEKLSSTVSTIPPGAIHPHLQASDDAESVSSEASDPSEMFHRDAGVQTSPPDSLAGENGAEKEEGSAVEGHVEKLQRIKGHLREAEETSGKAADSHKDARSEVAELQGYLEDLRFGSARLGKWDQVAGQWVGGAKDDEIGRVKAEIRSVKGVLLSARSFPARGPRR